MESSGSVEGELGIGGLTVIETATDVLQKSAIFHLIKEIVGFVLYMHHQIPAILQQLQKEFDMLQNESKDLESISTKSELNATSRRKHNARIREVKQGIRRMKKLMTSISTLVSALQLALSEVPNIESVILALGGSLFRPQYVYEVLFSHIRVASDSESDCTKSRAAEALSRKAIRALVSNGAGACSYAGPVKLSLLIKAPATFNLPQHFLPKRDFKYSKKTTPFRLLMKCKNPNDCMDELHHNSQNADYKMSNSSSNEFFWFQCRHTIKGLASKIPLAEE